MARCMFRFCWGISDSLQLKHENHPQEHNPGDFSDQEPEHGWDADT
jgi:hypothetical protein